MADLFPIEDYKRVSYPEIKPLETPYFCVGFYIGRGGFKNNWKIFSEMWCSQDNPIIQKFIAEKESNGWIMFVCRLPDFKVKVKNGKDNIGS
jgi:hypothetical protein